MSIKTGDRLKDLRKKHNFTQRDISNFLDISQSLVAKIESNDRNLDLAKVLKLCDLYNVSAEYILYGEGEFDVNNILVKKDNKAIDLKTLVRMNKIINNLKEMDKLYENNGNK